MDSSLLSREMLMGASTLASGAVSAAAGNLMSEWLGTAGRKVRQKFGTPEQKKALQEVIRLSLEKALTHLSVCAGGRRYNERQFMQWLQRERVVDEFIVLLTPQDKELLNVDVLFAEFEAAGLQLARTSFDELIKLMVAVFYKVASSDPLLCQTLQTESLRYIAEEMGALAQLEKLAEKHLEVSQDAAHELARIRQHTQEMASGQRLNNELLAYLIQFLQTTRQESLTIQQQSYQAVESLVARAYDIVLRDDKRIETTVDEPALQVVVQLLGEIRLRLTGADTVDYAELRDMEAQYRQRVIELFEMLTFKGISHSGKPIVLPLEEVYVELKAVADVPKAADTYSADERRLLIEADEKGMDSRELALQMDTLRVERWREAARQRSDVMQRRSIHQTLNDPTQRGLVILGDPGSGKSTLLYYLALQAARGESIAGTARVPIFVPLAAYDDYMARNQIDMTLLDFMGFYYEQWRSLPGLGPLFEHILQAGRALLLFDGLDEVLTGSARQQVANQVYGLMQQWRTAGNCFIMTSRIVGYREITPPREVPHVTVLDFGRSEIDQFAEQWCLAFARWTKQGKMSDIVQQEAEQAKQELLDDLYSSPSIERLAANPLLLTMLALMRHQTGKLPERRIRLYDRYMDVLLTTRQESRSSGARKKQISHLPERDEAEEHLIELAFWLQTHKPSGTASREELRDAMTEIFLCYEGYEEGKRASRKARIQARKQADKFVENLRYFAGMLAERGRDAFGFLHLTFQEYYVGRALARLDADERWQTIQAKLHHPRWHEPILLCAGQLGIMENRRSSVNSLISEILRANSPHEALLYRNLFLATDIMADNVNLSSTILNDLTQRLQDLQNSPIPTIRNRALAGLAQLARFGNQKALNALKKGLAQPMLQRHVIRAVKPVLEHKTCSCFIPLITENIENYDFIVQWTAIEALARLMKEDPSIQTTIITKLDDSDYYARWVTVKALAKVIQNNAQIEVVIRAKLDDSSWQVRQAAVETFAKVIQDHGQAQTAIITKLDDPSEWVRQAAVKALVELIKKDGSIQALIIAKLNDSSEWVQAAAVKALAGLIKEDLSMQASIIAKLSDSSYHVRQAALEALAELVKEDHQTQVTVITMLDDSSEWVRQAAVQALSQLVKKDTLIKEVIIGKLNDSSQKVRQAAVEALSLLCQENQALMNLFLARINDFQDYDIWQAKNKFVQILSQIIKEDGLSKEIISDKLNNLSSEVRLMAAQVHTIPNIAKEDIESKETIIAKLHYSSEWVREEAVQSLAGLITDNLQIQTIIRAKLNDSSWRVRQAAVEVLAKVVANDAQTLAAIIAKLDDPSEWVRQAAVQALAGLLANDAQTLTTIIAKLDDSSEWVRQAAVQALAGLLADDAQTLAAITAKLDDLSENVRQAAVQALLGEERQGLLRETIYALLAYYNELPHIVCLAIEKVIEEASIRKALLAKPQDLWASFRSLAMRVLTEFVAQGGRSIHRFVSWLGFIVERTHELEEDKGLKARCLLGNAFAPHLANDVVLYEQVVSLLDSPSWAARQGAAWALLRMPDGRPTALLLKLRGVLDDRRGEESWPERLQVAEHFINHRDPELSSQAIAAVVDALDFATQPWYVMPELGRQVRKQAAQILGQLEPVYYDDKIFARLVRVLEEDEDAQVCDAAFRALERLAAAPGG